MVDASASRPVARAKVAMVRGSRLLAVFAISVLAAVACQGSAIHRMPTPPLPTRLEGPSPFELPAFRWNTDRETVHRKVCVGEEGAETTVSRAVGVKRHENGLTEVRLEMNGNEMGRAFYSDTGRLVHMTVTEEFKKKVGDVDWGGMMGTFDVLHQPLAQRHPASFKIPVGKIILKSTERLPPELRAWNFVGRIEYLGQTTFNGVRSAVYHLATKESALRLPGPLTLRNGSEVVASSLTLRFDVGGVTYYDASIGIELYTHMTMRFEIEAILRDGGGRSRTQVMTCQNTLDRSASKGL